MMDIAKLGAKRVRDFVVTIAIACVIGFMLIGNAAAQTPPQAPFKECPAISLDTSCGVLIVINANGSVSVYTDPNQGPYDTGGDDTLVGVLNNSSTTVTSLPLNGQGAPIFGFEGDGICDKSTGMVVPPQPAGCPFGVTGYEGPGVTFTTPMGFSASGCVSPWQCANDQNASTGTVNFTSGLKPGASTYFALEEALTASNIIVPPNITSLSPSSAAAGAPAFTLTINGNNFQSGATVIWTSPGGQPATLTPASVAASTIAVSIAASLIATAGNATVVVQNPGNVLSSAAVFQITAPAVVPQLTSLNPSSVTAGGPQFNLTITGTNMTAITDFILTAFGSTFDLAKSGIPFVSQSATQLVVTIPASYITTPGTVTIAGVYPSGGASLNTNTLTFTIAAPALPAISVSGGNGASVNPQTSKAFSITLPSAAVTASTGTLSLSFAHNAVNGVTNSDAAFSSPTPGFSFTPGQTQATLTPGNLTINSGTVAGTITVSVASFNGSTPATPINGTIVVPRTAPVITGVTLANHSASGFDVCVQGYSDTRDITGVSFQFTASGTGTLSTTQLQATGLPAQFTTMYQKSVTSGTGTGLFDLDQNFSLSGSDSAIGSVTVTLQNGAGSTTSSTINYSGFASSCP